MPPDFVAGLIAYKHRSVSSCHFSLLENRLLFLVEREKQQESFLWTGRENSRKYVCVRRLSSREMTISSCESVLFFLLLFYFTGKVCFSSLLVFY